MEFSRKEERELDLLSKATTFNEQLGKVQAHYPIVGDAAKMKDNYWQARKMTEGLEWRLQNNNKLETYNTEFKE